MARPEDPGVPLGQMRIEWLSGKRDSREDRWLLQTALSWGVGKAEMSLSRWKIAHCALLPALPLDTVLRRGTPTLRHGCRERAASLLATHSLGHSCPDMQLFLLSVSSRRPFFAPSWAATCWKQVLRRGGCRAEFQPFPTFMT